MADYNIGSAITRIEEELIASMMQNFSRHRAEETELGFDWAQWQALQFQGLETYRRRNQKRFPKRFRSINWQLEKAIRDAHRKGGAEQEAAILEAIKAGADLHRSAGTLGGAFFRVNDRKLDALVNATVKDLEKAEYAILRRADDQYRKIIFDAQVYANSGGTYEKAVDMATKDFLSSGLTCVVYKNGAHHTLSDYADMALKTAVKRAYLQGEGQMRQQWGISTVILNKRTDACPKCARFAGKVYIDDVWSGGSAADGDYPLLSEAIRQGLYHPRCRDSHTTFFPGITDEESLTSPYTKEEMEQLSLEDVQREKAQHAQRQAEIFRRMEKYTLDKDNRTQYQGLAEKWEEKQINQLFSSVFAATEQMDYPYGVSLEYQFHQVRKAIIDDPDTTFAYNAKRDILLFNPKHPKFYDYEFVPSVLHELGHRYDATVVHSWEQSNFVNALTAGKTYVSINSEQIEALVMETAGNGFVQDILNILGDGELDTFAGHEKLSPKQQAAEVFANLTTLKALKSPDYQKIEKVFPDLARSFEHMYEGE